MPSITDGNGNNECEVSFGFNKYNKPNLIENRTSVANTIINALFMVPGNNPSDPLAGVDIRSYFYMFEDEISTDEIKTKLDNTCGALPGGAMIKDVQFSTVTEDNITMFILLIRIHFPDDETVLGLVTKSDNETRDVVNFNFDYVDI